MMDDDSNNFRQVMKNSNSQRWINATNEEINSLKDNQI